MHVKNSTLIYIQLWNSVWIIKKYLNKNIFINATDIFIWTMISIYDSISMSIYVGLVCKYKDHWSIFMSYHKLCYVYNYFYTFNILF